MVERNKQTLRQLLVDFMSYTTSHGVGRLVASTTALWKFFWISSCLGASVMFAYQVEALFKIYLSNPVETSYTINFARELKFPAVTLCNLNMIKSNKLPQELNSLFPTKGKSGNETKKQTNITNGNKETNEFKSEFDHTGLVSNLLATGFDTTPDYADLNEEYPDETLVNNETKLRKAVDLLIGGLKPDELYPNGHSMEDMIQACYWKGLDCKDGNYSKLWTQSWNHKYGNCFTFNNGVDEDSKPGRILKATKPGLSQGLVLEIAVEEELYIGLLSKQAGIRVAVHDQGVMPFPYEEGFSVAPGTATSVALTKTLIKRLDRFSNGSCYSESAPSETNIYKLYRNTTRYSKQGCINSCLGLSQWYTCGCSESAFPTESTPCDIFKLKDRRCLQILKHLYNTDQLKCLSKCQTQCTEDVYHKTISSSRWPSKAYKSYLNSQNQSVESGTLTLSVFYSELNYETVEEKFSYGTTKLLADIGGLLGLWIGISVLTVCELLELILKLISLAYTKFKTRTDVTERK